MNEQEKLSEDNLNENIESNNSNLNNLKEDMDKIETKGLKLKKSTKDRLNLLQGRFDDAESMIITLLNQYETFSIENDEKFSDRKAEIDRFNFLLESIKSSFVNSLEMASFIQDKYSESMKEEIKKKNKIISVLQEENSSLKSEINKSSVTLDKKDKELVEVKDSFSRVNVALATVERELTEKSEVIQNLQLHINSLTDIANESKKFKVENEKLKSSMIKKEEEINSLKLKCEKVEYLNIEKEKYKDDIDSLKMEVIQYKDYIFKLNEKIQSILIEKSLEIAKVNEENTKYIRSIENKNNIELSNVNEKNNQLQEEIFNLRLQLQDKKIKY